jgi:beta-glucosidase-like glycosyl hydrolase
MTDDLEMGAIANRYGAAEATRLAIEAGEELLLFCHNPACVEIACDQIASMPEASWKPALQSVAALKTKLAPAPKLFDQAAFLAINNEIKALRLKVQAALKG